MHCNGFIYYSNWSTYITFLVIILYIVLMYSIIYIYYIIIPDIFSMLICKSYGIRLVVLFRSSLILIHFTCWSNWQEGHTYILAYIHTIVYLQE